MWITFALLAAILFAAVHVLDSHCVDEIFDKPWMGMVTSAYASILIVVPLPFVAPFLSWSMPPVQIILIALLAGAFIQFSQALYFQALAYSEAGIVAAYWNMIPAILPMMSIIILHEVLTFTQYLGILVLILSSSFLLLIDQSKEVRMKSFFLMLVASILQAGAYLLLDHIYYFIPYLQAFVIMTVGIIISGGSPMLIKSMRQQVVKSFSRLIPYSKFFIFIEIVNLGALAAAQRSVSLGNPSLVAAVETTMPAFTFIISILFLFSKSGMGDMRSLQKIPWKLSAVVLMTCGVILVS